jgi:hypothetical protein
MQIQVRECQNPTFPWPESRSRRLLGRIMVCMAAVAMASGAGMAAAQTTTHDPNKPYLLPQANRLPDVNQQMEMHDQQAKKQSYAAANAERKKQITEDTANLLKLASDLMAEVDKTDKDALSLNVIRKADEIERLAHNVKEKMKLTVGGS